MTVTIVTTEDGRIAGVLVPGIDQEGFARWWFERCDGRDAGEELAGVSTAEDAVDLYTLIPDEDSFPVRFQTLIFTDHPVLDAESMATNHQEGHRNV